MSEPIVGEVRMFSGSFAPRGWAFCHGQLLPIAQNTVLFSVLGITYGGDGQTTFGLPDLRGRMPLGYGQTPGLSAYAVGQKGGAETVVLDVSQMPAHNHSFAPQCSAESPTCASPSGAYPCNTGSDIYSDTTTINSEMGSSVSAAAGGNQAHNNMPPYLCLSFIIAVQGAAPVRG